VYVIGGIVPTPGGGIQGGGSPVAVNDSYTPARRGLRPRTA